MSTVAEVREISKLVLSRNPELAMVRRVIILTPITHVARFIVLDNLSGKHRFEPTWSVSPLFRCNAGVLSHYSGYLYYPKPMLWDVTNPDASTMLAEAVERVGLPLLRSVQTIADFRNFAIEERFPGQRLDLFPLHKIIIDIALGDFESADRQAAALFDVPNMWSGTNWLGGPVLPSKHYNLITQVICPMLAKRDVKGLARQLHEWEEQTIKWFKLEKYWRPAPYPLELMG